MKPKFLVLLCLSLFPALARGRDPAPALTVMAPMRDGVRLATDIYLPHPEARNLPCIVVRTPYGRKQYNREYGSWVRWGYAIALQDVRGRFDSEGKAMPFLHDGWGEKQDGYDTVEWLARQKFSNGRVGTVGASAMGITQMLMAPAAPPSLRCQYISVAAASHYHHAAYVGGTLRKSQVERWLMGNGFHPDSLRLVLEHPLYDAYWRAFDASAVAGRVRVPAIHYGGWFDTFSEGTIDSFLSRQNQGGNGARGRQKLVMGPWTHGGQGKSQFGDFRLPRAARSVPVDISARRWFDHHLKGEANGAEQLPAVTYYVMGPMDGSPSGGNVWRTADSWPVPSHRRPFYLASDGKLLEGTAPSSSGSVSFRYDPENPVPTVGGRNLHLEAGPKDQRSIEDRDDVLVFTSPSLSEEVEVTGRVTARVCFSSDRTDTDIALRLCDVYPDRRSILIAEGIRRLATRNGFTKEEFLTPGRPVEVEVDLWSTSIVFAKGHRIRLSVTSSNFPRSQRNPNTGKRAKDDGKSLVATNTVHIGGATPSRLLLPLTRRGGQPLR